MRLPQESRLRWTMLLLLLSALPMTASAARQPVKLDAMSSSVEMAPTVAMSNLAKECKVDQVVSERVGEQMRRTFRKMNLAESLPTLSGEERGLKLGIVNMFGLGGGNYSGPKWMVIRAEVVGPEGVISARDFRRVSVASFSGLFMGTCHVMGKVAAKAGADMRKWLRQGAPGTPVPTLDAEDDEMPDVPPAAEEPEAPSEPASAPAPASA